jgi:phage terminase Nu1 subunit (DNA packaging protein)
LCNIFGIGQRGKWIVVEVVAMMDGARDDPEVGAEKGWLVAHPLPVGVECIDMNQNDMAKALNVTANTLGKWLAEKSFPVVHRGGQGKQYVLRLSHCWAWKLQREDNEASLRRQSEATIQKMQASFLGLGAGDPNASLSPKDRRELADADFAFNRAANLRRRLVELEEVRDLLDSVFSILRDGLQSLPDRLERELSLKSEEVGLVVRVSEEMLSEMSEKIDAGELKERDIAEEMPERQLLI